MGKMARAPMIQAMSFGAAPMMARNEAVMMCDSAVNESIEECESTAPPPTIRKDFPETWIFENIESMR